MYRLAQTSWYEYSKERILEWMKVAPVSLDIKNSSSLYFYFPEGQGKGAEVRYVLNCGLRRLRWTGVVSCSTEDAVTVRLQKGPFRGFTAKHSFIREGAITACEDQLEFQGEPEELREVLKGASVRYEFEARDASLQVHLAHEKEKQTGFFPAVPGESAG